MNLTHVNKGKTSHQDTVEYEINQPPLGEDGPVLFGRVVHGVFRGGLQTKSQGRRTSGDGVDPQCGDWTKRVLGDSEFVLEGETDEQYQDFGDVTGQQVKQEFRQVGECRTSLSNGTGDRGEVVVGQDNIRDRFGDVRTIQTHSNTNIGTLQGRRIYAGQIEISDASL